MAKESGDLKAKGRFTQPNPLSAIPDGGVLTAKNAVVLRDNVYQPRPGFKKYGSVAASGQVRRVVAFQNRLIRQNPVGKLAKDDGAGTWTDYTGSFSPPQFVTTPSGVAASHMDFAEAQQNLYFTASDGTRRLDNIDNTPEQAGMAKGLDGEATLNAAASGFLAVNGQAAYRVVWGKTDANGNKIVGAPSQRIVIGNNGVTSKDVDLAFTIPSSITTSHFYQVYRSGQTTALSIEPDDEMQLVVEASPSAGQITAKSVTYTDVTPDDLRGPTLYTSPSQEGLPAGNEPPPIAHTLAVFKDCLFLGNTLQKYRMTINLIAIGTPSGIVANDTITINSVVYTAKAAETIASGFFKVFTTGTPAENIDNTARSLVKVINQYASNTAVYAYYMTGFDDLPGKILIEERAIGGASFGVISSRGGAFSPTIPASASTYSASRDRAPGRLYIAKAKQPDAVPLLQYLDVGGKSQDILRTVATRDSLFVFKKDGIWRITGETPADFRVTLFDRNVILKLQKCAVQFNNSVVAVTNKGVVIVSETGVQIISRQIEDQIAALPAYTSATAFADSGSWILPIESDSAFVLFTLTPSDIRAGSFEATIGHYYNAITDAWTHWDLPASGGVCAPFDDKIYMAYNTDKIMRVQRRNFYPTDYADDEVALTYVGYTADVVQVASTTGVQVGDTLADVASSELIIYTARKVTEIVDATHLRVDQVSVWHNTGVLKAYRSYEMLLEYPPHAEGNPFVLKHFSEFYLAMEFFADGTSEFPIFTVSFVTDLVTTANAVALTPNTEGGNVQTVRTSIPREMSRAGWVKGSVSHQYALRPLYVLGKQFTTQNDSGRAR